MRKWSGGVKEEDTPATRTLFDPRIAREKARLRDARWMAGWIAINELRPDYISLEDIYTQCTERVPAVHAEHVTEQMSPVTTGHNFDAIPPKTTNVLQPTESEYRMNNRSLLINMQLAVEQAWILSNTACMPTRMSLSRFNIRMARIMDYIQEAEVNGQPTLFFVYADTFLIRIEEYILLSDQIILCSQ
jgi:hypothetical protein